MTLRLHYPAGFNATCTHLHPFCLAVLDAPYLLKVGIPALLRLIMGMAYIVSDNRFFSANLADF